jgi:hypothetical protein
MSPPSLGRISEIPVLPPGFLGTGNAFIAEQDAVARMANAVYEHYEELRFNSFSWVYWHAMCAPVHMAAGHFGAAIEALRRAYSKSHPGKIEGNLVSDKKKWNKLIEPFLKEIAAAELDQSVKDILSNRVRSNLNPQPAEKLSEAFLAAIGVTLGPLERAAWMLRNKAAHGAEVDLDSAVSTIRDTKLLKIILHRIVLKITGASDRYYDDYTIGHAVRDVIEPVPSPAAPISTT